MLGQRLGCYEFIGYARGVQRWRKGFIDSCGLYA